MLKGKKILLAICGSISFYKSFELLSMLKKAGASVKVALSDGVLNFVNPEPFEALSGHKVLSSKTQNWLDGINHIEYGKCDLVVIAPASVNTINKLANGVCDNIFMQTLVATKAPIIIAPAANERMLMNFATLNSLKILIHNGVKITNPQIKKLACGEIANGGLAEVMDIYLEICKAFYKDKFFENKTVVVTAGATTEKIDDVRAVTNLSSGKTGKALADAYFLLGANVVFISSINFEVPYKFIKFDTSIGLKTALKSQNLKSGDIVVMAAAVSDYLPVRVKGKMKKEDLSDVFALNFKKNEDIIANFNPAGVKKIGFKLEVDKLVAKKNAKNALSEKNLDAICLNLLSDVVKFGSENTEITFIGKNREVFIEAAPKTSVAMQIAKLSKSLFDE